MKEQPVNPLVRKLWAKGITNTDIAKHFNVTPAFVSLALSGHRDSDLAKKIRDFVQELLDKEPEQQAV